MKSGRIRVASVCALIMLCTGGFVSTGCGGSTTPKTTQTAASVGGSTIAADGSRNAVSTNALNTFQEAVKVSKSNPQQAVAMSASVTKRRVRMRGRC